MFRFLSRKPEIEKDHVFGILERKVGWFGACSPWSGTAKTALFPGRELVLDIDAATEAEMESHRKHFRLIQQNAEAVRKSMEEEVFSTYQVYSKEEPERDYRELPDAGAIWDLLAPRVWFFPRPQLHGDIRSFIGLEIDWPNPHDLVAYFDEDNLSVVQVEG